MTLLQYIAVIVQSLTVRCTTIMVPELTLIEVDACWQEIVNGGV